MVHISLRPRKPEGSLGRTAQDGHIDSHTALELCVWLPSLSPFIAVFGPLRDQGQGGGAGLS